MANQYLVSQNYLREVSELKREVEVLKNALRRIDTGQVIFQTWTAKATSAITAGDHTTEDYGSGTADFYHKDSSDGKVALTDDAGTTLSETVYNWTETEIASGTWIVVTQDTEGTWIVISEEC